MQGAAARRARRGVPFAAKIRISSNNGHTMAKRIAIVEDDPDQRANYRDAITKKGYDVAAYASRQEALIGIEREMPDLVDPRHHPGRRGRRRVPAVPRSVGTRPYSAGDLSDGTDRRNRQDIGPAARRLGLPPKADLARLSRGTNLVAAAHQRSSERDQARKESTTARGASATCRSIRKRSSCRGRTNRSTSPAPSSGCSRSSFAYRVTPSATKR